MNCNECKYKKTDNKPVEPVPYIVHEAAMARAERHNKRLWIAVLVLAVVVFATNAIWLWAWTSYDYTSEEYSYSQDGEGVNVIGDSNEVHNNGAETGDPQTEAN